MFARSSRTTPPKTHRDLSIYGMEQHRTCQALTCEDVCSVSNDSCLPRLDAVRVSIHSLRRLELIKA